MKRFLRRHALELRCGGRQAAGYSTLYLGRSSLVVLLYGEYYVTVPDGKLTSSEMKLMCSSSPIVGQHGI